VTRDTGNLARRNVSLGFLSSSGMLAMLTAMRRASSLLSSLAADRKKAQPSRAGLIVVAILVAPGSQGGKAARGRCIYRFAK
jgi:hypothetical protein